MARPARLSRDHIVAAALELADETGADGLTMRGLARRLGVDPMAVYRHVRDKEDLLGAMCDVAIAELSPLRADEPWEPQLRRLARELRAAILRRPALLPALAGAPATPAALAMAHDAVAVLIAAGADERTARAAFTLTFDVVLGDATVTLADPPAADPAALRSEAAALLGAPDPPHLDTAMAMLEDTTSFTAGLELLLDGVRSRIG